jgi:hypothetical protein
MTNNQQPSLFDWQPTAPNGEPIGKMLTTRRDGFGIVVTLINTPRPMGATISPTRLSRTNDPDTSQQAAESASRRGPSQRRRIWEALQELGDATDFELATKVGILRSSAAKRRQELQDLGHVIETPQRRRTDTGTLAIVWRCSYVSVYQGR